MRTNIKKFLMLILIVCLSAAWSAGQVVEKISPNVTQISGVVDAKFTSSGKFVVLQTDTGFHVVPAERLEEITGDVENAGYTWSEGWVTAYSPSGGIVVKTRRSLYTLDPQTEKGDEIYTASTKDEEKGNYLNDGELVVVSENLIISGDGNYDIGMSRGNIIRFDVRRGSYKRGARIDGFKKPLLSPSGKYVLYEHGGTDENYANLYDIARNVNYPIPQRFDFKRNFPKYKETLVNPLVWVTPNRFVAAVDENQFEEFKASANPLDIPDTPAWLVLFDAAGGKIVWKHQLKNIDAPGVLQLLSKTKAFFDDTNGIYEVSLADGKLTKLPAVAGTLFVISPDKTKMAYLDENRIIVSAAASGANKQTVVEVSKSWQNTISSIKWSPDGKRLLIFDKNNLLLVRLSAKSIGVKTMKYEKFDLIFHILVVALMLVLAAATSYGQTSSGGVYTMTKTVVAGGGSSDLQQNQMKAENTVGQAVAGRQSSGGNFTLYTGFWTPDGFAPTAANVVVGGQIKTADGRGIRNVYVTITSSNGQRQTALSGTFGYYRFAGISVGATYIISVSAKKYVFAQSTQLRTILDDTLDINFIADSLP